MFLSLLFNDATNC